MLLKQINKAYWIIGMLLYLFFMYESMKTTEQTYFYTYSFVAFLMFAITVSASFRREASFFTKTNLAFSVLFVSLIQVIILSVVSYSIDGDLFLFSKVDSLVYYEYSLKMSEMDLWDSVHYISQTYSFDDWGAFIWISTLFRISKSLMFVKLVHVAVGVWSSLLLFDVGRNFMPRRYAYVMSLTFLIASFTAVIHAVVSKETVFVFFIIATFHSFYKFLNSKNILHLVVVFLLSVAVAFFRLPVAIILFFAFVITLILMYTKGVAVIVLGVIFTGMIITSSYFAIVYESYLRAGDVEAMIERKEELAMGGGFVNHAADPLAALMGPFPSITVKKITKTSLYASGLLYRVLLAAPFFLGAYYVFRYRQKKLYPLVIFFLINAIGVAISIKGLEYRITHPHLPMAYTVAFWWLAQHDYKRIHLRLSLNATYIWFIIVLALSLIWNLR